MYIYIYIYIHVHTYVYIYIYPTLSLHKSDANPTEQSEFWFGCCGFLGKYCACLCVVSDVRSYMYCIGYRHAHMYPTACPASSEIGCYPAQLLCMVSLLWHISKSVWDLHVHTVSGPNLEAHHNSCFYLSNFIHLIFLSGCIMVHRRCWPPKPAGCVFRRLPLPTTDRRDERSGADWLGFAHLITRQVGWTLAR